MSEELGWVPFVGQKVCCILAPVVLERYRRFVKVIPKAGKIFTIAEIFQNKFDGRTGFHFVEIAQSFTDQGKSIGFAAQYFRPVVEPKTSIAVFEAMLVPTKRSVDA